MNGAIGVIGINVLTEHHRLLPSFGQILSSGTIPIIQYINNSISEGRENALFPISLRCAAGCVLMCRLSAATYNVVLQGGALTRQWNEFVTPQPFPSIKLRIDDDSTQRLGRGGILKRTLHRLRQIIGIALLGLIG
jgi:hypothetical protein